MNLLSSHEVVRVAGGLSPVPLPAHGAVVFPGGPVDWHVIGLPRLPPLPSPASV